MHDAFIVRRLHGQRHLFQAPAHAVARSSGPLRRSTAPRLWSEHWVQRPIRKAPTYYARVAAARRVRQIRHRWCPITGCKCWKSQRREFGAVNAFPCCMAQTTHALICPSSPQAGYERHRPEQTSLYQTVAAYWHKFLERAEEAGGLPDFVKREVEAYLDCGILGRGHVTAQCPECGFEREVPFSCKKRGGICPSCMGRRMNDTAVHLVDRVLPLNTPIRQWVCSMRFSLRYLMGYDKKLCADILSV